MRPGARPTIADLAGGSAHVLVQADPEAYLPATAARRLLELLESGEADIALPVTNEPWCEAARREAPFPYHTPALLEEAARAVAAAAGGLVSEGPFRSPVYAARREALAGFPRDLPLDAAVERAAVLGRRVRVDPGAYLHRYGEMDGQAREDLAARIPDGSRVVLDVGCSRGATAAALRRAGVTEIVGIEPDPGDALQAARRYDRVLAVPLEAVSEDFAGRFDAVLFGDVLEHLADPSAALLRVRPWLSARGAVVASVPNVGHWSVIADLLQGRFDYVPYSILSGTHVRFFTRRTLSDLFEACGFDVPRIEAVRFAPSPSGVTALERLKSIPGAADDLDVVEFVAVARRGMVERRAFTLERPDPHTQDSQLSTLDSPL
ncbi:MAG: class I SAM-dependent methyltransferase [Acidobacteriota bacterium]|nr:class I SAM-dependent methyltransferase [Acidobacteriota bacterium]